MKALSKPHLVDTVDRFLSDAAEQQVIHLSTQDQQFSGRLIEVNRRSLINFGSCSYLGLELDDRLKEGAIDAIRRYGVQLSSSRTYLQSGLYEELESVLKELFGSAVLVASTTTLAHLSAIPVFVKESDAVILDHQVHQSVQTAVQTLRPKGVPVEIIRHSSLDMLREQIQKLTECQKYEKIWYMADGVYSMYGDLAPMNELVSLMEEFEQLHLYVDDAHGMSWCGKHGRGVVLNSVPMHPKMLLVTSLGKGFGVGGAAIVFPNKEMRRLVRTCGPTFIFSGPVQPPLLGAAIASARIHISEEIVVLQDRLQDLVAYTNAALQRHKLPQLSRGLSPISFIGVGSIAVGYNLVKRLISEGLYVNLAIFPAVSIKNTGIRFTINNHLQQADIDHLAEAMAWHLPIALEEENFTRKQIYQAFKGSIPEEVDKQELFWIGHNTKRY